MRWRIGGGLVGPAVEGEPVRWAPWVEDGWRMRAGASEWPAACRAVAINSGDQGSRFGDGRRQFGAREGGGQLPGVTFLRRCLGVLVCA
jgi:hypothetical protein